MDDLIAFLNARLDEDETAANAATQGPWQAGETPGNRKTMIPCIFVAYGTARPDAGHVLYEADYGTPADVACIARHDPARVLREVAAKRAILASHSVTWTVVEQLAAVYSYHPDYRAEWKP